MNSEEAEKLAVEEEREAASQKWQPIETAPKDKDVIIAVSDPARPTIVGQARWFDGDEDWWWAGTSPKSYAAGPVSEVNFGKPTHWMPLPSAPALSEPRPSTRKRGWHCGGKSQRPRKRQSEERSDTAAPLVDPPA